jgi:cyclophilin family peptidyl-prolyl cis-trans isomerase
MRRILTLFLLAAALGGLAQPGASAKPKKPKKMKTDFLVTISTSFGDMQAILYDATPKHKANFIKLAQEGYFDSTTFHRVIQDFMIQGGDPNSKPGGNAAQIGSGGPGYTIDAEFVPGLSHIKGALSAARQGDQVNPKRASSGSQFYIVHNGQRCVHLNGQYTVFGQVIQGLEVIDAIATQPVDRRMGDRPRTDIRMTVKVEEMKRKKITEEYGYTYPEESAQ